MKTKEKLVSIMDALMCPNKESLELSMNHVHGVDIFSLVIRGTEFGKLTRIFISDRKLKPIDVQYHTHTYPLIITALKGVIVHHNATIEKHGVCLPLYEYKSPLNGGSGLSYMKDVKVELSDHVLPVGSITEMNYDDFHTMSCSKGSMWMVEELGFQSNKSLVLGMPFITDGLYKKPEMFQINDMSQRVLTEVRKLVDLF